MRVKEFFKIILESIKDLIKNPKLIISGIILWIFIFLFSKLSSSVNKIFVNTSSLIIWLVIFSIISLTAFSFVFSGMIGTSSDIIKRKGERYLSGLFKYSREFFLKNLIILIIISVIGSLIWIIVFYLGMRLGQLMGLDVSSATILYILIYFVFIISTIIFLTFSGFILVLENKGIVESIKKSIKFVKRNYIETLVLNILIF